MSPLVQGYWVDNFKDTSCVPLVTGLKVSALPYKFRCSCGSVKVTLGYAWICIGNYGNWYHSEYQCSNWCGYGFFWYFYFPVKVNVVYLSPPWTLRITLAPIRTNRTKQKYTWTVFSFYISVPWKLSSEEQTMFPNDCCCSLIEFDWMVSHNVVNFWYRCGTIKDASFLHVVKDPRWWKSTFIGFIGFKVHICNLRITSVSLRVYYYCLYFWFSYTSSYPYWCIGQGSSQGSSQSFQLAPGAAQYPGFNTRYHVAILFSTCLGVSWWGFVDHVASLSPATSYNFFFHQLLFPCLPQIFFSNCLIDLYFYLFDCTLQVASGHRYGHTLKDRAFVFIFTWKTQCSVCFRITKGSSLGKKCICMERFWSWS